MLLVLSFVSCDGQSKIGQSTKETIRVKPDTAMPAVLVGNDNVKFGYPGGKGFVLVKKCYVILYDTTTLVPEWVTYHLTKEDLQGIANRANDFRPDPDLPVGKRSEINDYQGSGYDRGHQAPAADFKRSEEAMSETFFLSNMAPQRPKLNRGIWSKLEDQVRKLAGSHGSIWVFTGPLYLDSLDHRVATSEHIGPHNVAVPTHFFKAILCEHPDGTHEMFTFLMKNQLAALPGKPKDYLVTVHRVEGLSGLDFFHALPDSEETRLESAVAGTWPVQ